MPRKRKYVKRENGSGSVYCRKDVKARPWYVTAPTEYREVNGKWVAVRMPLGSFATREEAKAVLDAYMQAPSALYNITVGEIAEEWLERVRQTKSSGTYDVYRAAWKKCERLADFPVRELKTIHIQQIIDDYAGKSASVLNNIKIVMSAVCKYGVKNDLLTKDYAALAETSAANQQEKKPFTSLEVERIRRAVGVVPWADVIYFMIYTGWRISELLDLTCFSWDAEAKTLTGGHKTEAGKNRVVPVHPNVLPILEEWLAKGGETIFCRPDGKRWRQDDWRTRCYYPALDQIDGVRKLSPHACRHTAITMAAAAGMRPEEMMAIFGHAGYQIEVDRYLHPETETLSRAVNKIG